MGGRLDDWLKQVASTQRLLIEPGCLDWAGVAALKRAYAIFQERGYRARVLSAAFRNGLQWSELLGGDLVVSPPFDWQLRINENELPVERRIDVPVDERIIAELSKISDFCRAYEPDGMTVEELTTSAPLGPHSVSSSKPTPSSTHSFETSSSGAAWKRSLRYYKIVTIARVDVVRVRIRSSRGRGRRTWPRPRRTSARVHVSGRSTWKDSWIRSVPPGFPGLSSRRRVWPPRQGRSSAAVARAIGQTCRRGVCGLPMPAAAVPR